MSEMKRFMDKEKLSLGSKRFDLKDKKPNPVLVKYAASAKCSIEQVKAIWDKAKQTAAASVGEDSPDYWSRVNAITRRQLQLKEEKTSFKEALQLNELHGYKQYEDKGLVEILQQWVKDNPGLNYNAGAFGIGIVPASGDFIYKIWANDGGYDAYINLVSKHQNNPFFPKLKGKIHKIPSVFKRPEKAAKLELSIVKLEKLKDYGGADDKLSAELRHVFLCLNDLAKEDITLEKIKSLITLDPNSRQIKRDEDRHKRNKAVAIHKNAKNKYMTNYEGTAKTQFSKELTRAMNGLRNITLLKKRLVAIDLVSLVEALYLVKETADSNNLKFDLHAGNFMMRGTQLVLTDPFVTAGWDDDKTLIRLDDASRLRDNDYKAVPAVSGRNPRSTLER